MQRVLQDMQGGLLAMLTIQASPMLTQQEGLQPQQVQIMWVALLEMHIHH